MPQHDCGHFLKKHRTTHLPRSSFARCFLALVWASGRGSHAWWLGKRPWSDCHAAWKDAGLEMTAENSVKPLFYQHCPYITWMELRSLWISNHGNLIKSWSIILPYASWFVRGYDKWILSTPLGCLTLRGCSPSQHNLSSLPVKICKVCFFEWKIKIFCMQIEIALVYFFVQKATSRLYLSRTSKGRGSAGHLNLPSWLDFGALTAMTAVSPTGGQDPTGETATRWNAQSPPLNPSTRQLCRDQLVSICNTKRTWTLCPKDKEKESASGWAFFLKLRAMSGEAKPVIN